MKTNILLACLLALLPLTSHAQSSNLDKLFGNTPKTQQQPVPTPAAPTAAPVSQPAPRAVAPVPAAQASPALTPSTPSNTQLPPQQGSDRMSTLSVPEQRTVFANCLKSMGITKIRVMTTEETNTLVSCLSK